MEGRLVVDCDLFASLDIAEGDEEDVAVEDFHVAVGFAGMIYVVCAVAALAAIETPTLVNRADTEASSSSTTVSFSIGYSFAGVLGYLFAPRKVSL